MFDFLSMIAMRPPGRDHAAHLGDGDIDFDGVLERFGRIGGVERRGSERQRGHRAEDRLDAGGTERSIGLGQIQRDDLGAGVDVLSPRAQTAPFRNRRLAHAHRRAGQCVRDQLNVIMRGSMWRKCSSSRAASSNDRDPPARSAVQFEDFGAEEAGKQAHA